MGTDTKMYFNIAMELVCLINMSILLTAVIFKKNKSKTNQMFIFITATEILILTFQLLQWFFYPNTTALPFHGKDRIFVYILFNIDFSLMFFGMLLFCYYVFARINEEKTFNDKKKKLIKHTTIFLLIYCAAICLIYLSSIFTGAIYSFDENGMFKYNAKTYLVILNSILVIAIVCIYAIIKNRRVLGRMTSYIMLLFVASRIFVLPFDLVHSTILSYILPAFVILILYLGVELRKGKKMQEQEVRIANQNAEIEAKNTQIMVSQIQPHFLYNTLSVIDYLCGSDVVLARKTIKAFSKYLRTNMESISSVAPVPFEKELEHTKTYLWIEKIRFDDLINIEYNIKETNFLIPSLTVQPLCENAVKHGLRRKENGGTIKLSTESDGDKIFITVEDDGIGFDVSVKPTDNRLHVGIENVRNRIETICKGKLEITSTPGEGTKAVIILEKKDENTVS